MKPYILIPCGLAIACLAFILVSPHNSPVKSSRANEKGKKVLLEQEIKKHSYRVNTVSIDTQVYVERNGHHETLEYWKVDICKENEVEKKKKEAYCEASSIYFEVKKILNPNENLEQEKEKTKLYCGR